MGYLKFDKNLLTNLERSLTKETLRTNNAGAYSSSSVIDCNTRKFHGLLVVPIPELEKEGKFVLLSSLDETVIQHGAEFNLGIHKYQGDNYSPRGHKYIREFYVDSEIRTIYRVGGVVFQKERILVQGDNRVLLRYTLLDAHSPTTLRFKPFLAFRSVNELTHQNSSLNTHFDEVENGVSFCLYRGYPHLHLQFSKKVKFVPEANWYNGIEYYKEQERGYEFSEDLYVPGYFELSIKKGESIVFSAGLTPTETRGLKRAFDREKQLRTPRSNFYNSLFAAVRQFYNKKEDGYYLLAGYPWFKFRARDEFIALPGATLAIGEVAMFEEMMRVGVVAVRDFIEGRAKSTKLKEVSAPDVLLWFVWAVQQYAATTSLQNAAARYGEVLKDIVEFIRKQNHPNLQMHPSGLLFTEGKQKPATWMNAVENDLPITPRTGYVVEINALWFNALCFVSEVMREMGDVSLADILSYQSEITRQSFVAKFWNGIYLYDYVDGDYCDREVRPNMIFAVSLPYSPLDKKQQKSVLDIVTRELLTPKGLRSLSPKSPFYRPEYIGGMLERNRNYHNGPIWAWTSGAFAEAYLRVHGRSGVSFLDRMMAGFESELSELCIGSLSELYDGNPPFKGHGAMSFAMTVAEILRVLMILKQYEEK